MREYADYIQQRPTGQAGRLRLGESEKHATVRRRLVTTAKTLGIPLVIRRSGNDLYFWREEEQPRRKRKYTRRRETKDAITAPDQPLTEPEEFQQAVSEQTTVSDAV